MKLTSFLKKKRVCFLSGKIVSDLGFVPYQRRKLKLNWPARLKDFA
uniref:Uncharacterized protein n=1 Tax=Rhizophora mucronata TaxID=61149 RepID=A0A2P2JTP0_RHIMU